MTTRRWQREKFFIFIWNRIFFLLQYLSCCACLNVFSVVKVLTSLSFSKNVCMASLFVKNTNCVRYFLFVAFSVSEINYIFLEVKTFRNLFIFVKKKILEEFFFWKIFALLALFHPTEINHWTKRYKEPFCIIFLLNEFQTKILLRLRWVIVSPFSVDSRHAVLHKIVNKR